MTDNEHTTDRIYHERYVCGIRRRDKICGGKLYHPGEGWAPDVLKCEKCNEIFIAPNKITEINCCVCGRKSKIRSICELDTPEIKDALYRGGWGFDETQQQPVCPACIGGME